MLAVLLRQLPHMSSLHKEASVDLTTFLLLLLYDTDCKYYTSVGADANTVARWCSVKQFAMPMSVLLCPKKPCVH
eukprot:scaffold14392_cov17-Tisochrysis_lutea.AAC.1